MAQNYRLLFGPLAGVILALGIAGSALLIPGYSHICQTVSEIGEIGSPARVPFATMLCCVAICILVFASAIRDVSIAAHHSPLAAYFIGFMALSALGVAVFAFPNPLHNDFGLSELVGYQAPLIFAVTWRRNPRAKTLLRVSWIAFVLMWCAIGLNLSTLDRHGALWAFERPFYGLVQRALFLVWFGWCAITGIVLFRLERKSCIR
jgi:hypothetical membrane protein